MDASRQLLMIPKHYVAIHNHWSIESYRRVASSTMYNATPEAAELMPARLTDGWVSECASEWMNGAAARRRAESIGPLSLDASKRRKKSSQIYYPDRWWTVPGQSQRFWWDYAPFHPLSDAHTPNEWERLNDLMIVRKGNKHQLTHWKHSIEISTHF